MTASERAQTIANLQARWEGWAALRSMSSVEQNCLRTDRVSKGSPTNLFQKILMRWGYSGLDQDARAKIDYKKCCWYCPIQCIHVKVQEFKVLQTSQLWRKAARDGIDRYRQPGEVSQLTNCRTQLARTISFSIFMLYKETGRGPVSWLLHLGTVKMLQIPQGIWKLIGKPKSTEIEPNKWLECPDAWGKRDIEWHGGQVYGQNIMSQTGYDWPAGGGIF